MLLEWVPHSQKLNLINASEAEGVYQTYQAFDALKRSFDMLSIKKKKIVGEVGREEGEEGERHDKRNC
jgi:hypothetical protein